jgi:hypothetical protein
MYGTTNIKFTELIFKAATVLRHVYWWILIDVSKTRNVLLWRGQTSKKRLLELDEITRIFRTVESS